MPRARPGELIELASLRDAFGPVQQSVNLFRAFAQALVHRTNAPVDKLPEVLKAKLSDIQSACPGFKVVSTICGSGKHSWNVRGTNKRSLHCANRAADFVVASYACAYRRLANWRGGLSGDPMAVNHVHLSVGGREGRFCHSGHRGRNCMFARRYKARVAKTSRSAV